MFAFFQDKILLSSNVSVFVKKMVPIKVLVKFNTK